MASVKCGQCGKVARAQMVQDKSVTPAVITYLCRACCKELGHEWKGGK